MVAVAGTYSSYKLNILDSQSIGLQRTNMERG